MACARLIEATIHCIVKAGYTNITPPQAAAEAGFSQGALVRTYWRQGQKPPWH